MPSPVIPQHAPVRLSGGAAHVPATQVPASPAASPYAPRIGGGSTNHAKALSPRAPPTGMGGSHLPTNRHSNTARSKLKAGAQGMAAAALPALVAHGGLTPASMGAAAMQGVAAALQAPVGHASPSAPAPAQNAQAHRPAHPSAQPGTSAHNHAPPGATAAPASPGDSHLAAMQQMADTNRMQTEMAAHQMMLQNAGMVRSMQQESVKAMVQDAKDAMKAVGESSHKAS